MPKLYFKYGAMGSSKSAQALMVKFNYEEKGYKVALIKPSVDDREGDALVKSRIGLSGKCFLADPKLNYYEWYLSHNDYQVIIVDEAQFLTKEQVEELMEVACNYIPVICFGLKTDFRTMMFEGSKRLFELANSITEIKSICKCGRKADVNARIRNGKILFEGEQVFIGGNESYVGMCYECWRKGRI